MCILGSLTLRTRNGRLKNSFNPGGTLLTLGLHPVGPKKCTCIDMKGLLKWPDTSFSYLLYILHFGLSYINFAIAWETQDRSYTLHLEDRKNFPVFARCSCFNVLVSMLRINAWRELIILEIINFLLLIII